MILDNDPFFDGAWVESPSRGDLSMSFHSGFFQIHRDAHFRGDKIRILGVLSRSVRGKTRFEFRADYFSQAVDNREWQKNIAPDYEILNLYGAVDFPSHIRFTGDISRNLVAGSGTEQKSSDAFNLTVVAGRSKKRGGFQIIYQYLQFGGKAVSPHLVSYCRRVNVLGTHTTVNYFLTRSTVARFDFLNWRKLEADFPTSKRYRRWELALNHSF